MSKILNLRRNKPAINFYSKEQRGLWNFSVPEECLALAKTTSRATETSSPLQFDKNIMESVVFIGQIGIDIQVTRALGRILFFFGNNQGLYVLLVSKLFRLVNTCLADR
jgi:hypothetical protein